MEEKWININDIYQVSDLGRIRSLPSKGYIDSSGHKRSKKGCILKFATRKDGYYIVNVSNFRHRRTWKVHQIVSFYFIPNPYNLPQVNHINGIKTDNRAVNLEWCDAKHNTRHAFNVLKIKPTSLFGATNASSKEVVDTKTGIKYQSINEAAKYLGMKAGTLSAMLTGVNPNKTNIGYA